MPGPSVSGLMGGRMAEEHTDLFGTRTAAAPGTLGELSTGLCGAVFVVEDRYHRTVIPGGARQSGGRTIDPAIMPIDARLLCLLGCDMNERETAHIPTPRNARKSTRELQNNSRGPGATGRSEKTYQTRSRNVPAARAG